MGRAACILTGLYVSRSQLSGGSKVDSDEFPLGADGTESEGTGQKRQSKDLRPQHNSECSGNVND